MFNREDVQTIVDNGTAELLELEAKQIECARLQYEIESNLSQLATLRGDLHTRDFLAKTFHGDLIRRMGHEEGYSKGVMDAKLNTKPF